MVNWPKVASLAAKGRFAPRYLCDQWSYGGAGISSFQGLVVGQNGRWR